MKMKQTKVSEIPKPGFNLLEVSQINEVGRESAYSSANTCPYEISKFIVDELGSIQKQIVKTRNKFIFKATTSSDQLLEVLRQKYLERVAKRVKESLSVSECVDDNLGVLQK